MPSGYYANPALGFLSGDDAVPEQLKIDLDTQFTLSSAYLVFFMQCGFALLECGSVRRINVKNILLKNTMDLSLGVLMWWATGYAFAYGVCGNNAFIGTTNFFLSSAQYQTGSFWAHWLFTLMFALVANALVHGAVSERMKLQAYLVYTAVLTGFVYPIVVHWTWSLSGWLSPFRIDCATGEHMPVFSDTNGFMDFAGSGCVHVVGGVTALIGAIVLGPRLGRFTKEGYVIEMPANSPAFQVLGTFCLWFGWYGFNPGSTGCFYDCTQIASKVAVNTTIAAATGGLTVLFVSMFLGRPGDIGPMLNGILSALVAITSPCAYCQPYAAFIVGMVAGAAYLAGAWLLRWLRIDDVMETSAVHLTGGTWGVISVGLFATKSSTYQAIGYANDWGVFYGGSGKQLGIQILGLVIIVAWTTAIMLPMWLALRWMGWLRVEQEQEKKGLDIAQSLGTGVPAWNFWLSKPMLSRLSVRSRSSRRSNQSTTSEQAPYPTGTTQNGNAASWSGQAYGGPGNTFDPTMASRDSAYGQNQQSQASPLPHGEGDGEGGGASARTSLQEGRETGTTREDAAQAARALYISIKEAEAAENPQVH